MVHDKIPDEKECSVCNEVKPIAQFRAGARLDSQGRPQFRGLCLGCHSDTNTASRRARPASHRERDSRKSAAQKFGLTLDEYNGAVALATQEQEGCCKICAAPFGDVTPHLDHCHETGALRGLLCRNCNVALGLMKDNPDWLRAAAEYVEQSRVSDLLTRVMSSDIIEEVRQKRLSEYPHRASDTRLVFVDSLPDED